MECGTNAKVLSGWAVRMGAHHKDVEGVQREGARQGAKRVGQCVWELTMRIFRKYGARELAKVLSGLGSACGSSP